MKPDRCPVTEMSVLRALGSRKPFDDKLGCEDERQKASAVLKRRDGEKRTVRADDGMPTEVETV